MNIQHTNKVPPMNSDHGETVRELVGAARKNNQRHSLAHITIEAGAASTRHHHLTGEETFYILTGSANMIIDGVSHPLQPGDACLILPGQVHQMSNAGNTPLTFIAVCVPAWTPGDSYQDA